MVGSQFQSLPPPLLSFSFSSQIDSVNDDNLIRKGGSPPEKMMTIYKKILGGGSQNKTLEIFFKRLKIAEGKDVKN